MGDYINKDNGNYGVRDTAKLLGMGQKEFVKWLTENNYAYRRSKTLIPYAKVIAQGYLALVERYDARGKSHLQMKVTPTGRDYFKGRIDKRAS